MEGTKAQLRVIETKSTNKSDISSEHYCSPSRDSTLIQSQVSTPSMKAMVPLAMDEMHHHHHLHQHLHHQHNQNNSSSTESAQDHAECDGHRIETPTKKRPSKIPLPGTKGYLAPKPPTGRTATATLITSSSTNTTTNITNVIGSSSSSSNISQRSPSGPPSNRSLSKSTGSLFGRSGPSSVKKDNLTSLNRPESAQNIRKDSSLLGQCGRSSSIPISSKISPPRINNSPVPKPRRESLTSKVRNMDSLSRIQSAPQTTPTGSTTNLYKTNSKKDLSSSFSTASSYGRDGTTIRKQQLSATAVPPPVRRVSSSSVNRVVDLSAPDSDNGKVQNLRTRLWNMLKI